MKHKSVLCIDVGLKRIGVAWMFEGVIVLLNAIMRKNRNQAASEVLDLLLQKRCDGLVVGVPKGGSCEEEMDRRVRHFVSLLDFDKSIYFVDESFSSKEASELKREIDIKRDKRGSDKRDGKLDSMSAMLILQRWLDKERL